MSKPRLIFTYIMACDFVTIRLETKGGGPVRQSNIAHTSVMPATSPRSPCPLNRQPPSQMDAHATTVSKGARKSKLFKNSVLLSWWWEIMASMVSVICVSLVMFVLGLMNNQPLTEWTLPIQINSLISVFITIAKAAVSVQVVSPLVPHWHNL